MPSEHFRIYHHADQDFLKVLKKVFVRLNTAHVHEVLNPDSFQLPINYLDIHYGWYCRRPLLCGKQSLRGFCQCEYLSQSTDHFMRHQNEVHRMNKPEDFLCQKVLMQSFFPNRYKRWFPVVDLTLFDHRPQFTRRPAWGIPILQTLDIPRDSNDQSKVDGRIANINCQSDYRRVVDVVNNQIESERYAMVNPIKMNSF